MKIDMKIPFMLKNDGDITVHDHDSGDVLENYEGLVGDYKGSHTSYFLFWYEHGERTMAHLGRDLDSAVKMLATIAIGDIKRVGKYDLTAKPHGV